jgi:prepilin-type N-terminal cleavage/methylation domain-containing protein
MLQIHPHNRTPGFTLIEIMLVVAAIGIMGGSLMLVSRPLIISNDLEIAAELISQAARTAQLNSQAVAGDVSWGIRIDSGRLTVFAGSSYAGRQIELDENFDLPGEIALTGINEVVFSKFSGEPDQTGDINLLAQGQTKTLTLNAKGIIDYH